MGRLPQAGSGKPGFNVAIITIVALHAVFFAGLLLQGCGPRQRETTTDLGLAQPPATNTAPADSFAGYTPPYTPPSAITTAAPPAYTNVTAYTPPDSTAYTGPATPSTVPTNLWDGTAMQPTNLVTTPEPPALPAAMTEYKIVAGDTPAKIARKHGITLDQLREANPDMDDRRLQIGHRLQIPAPAPKEAAALTPDAATGPAAQVYVVRPGDNLYKIAARHGTTVKELRSFNNLKTDRIVVDQKLKIPPSRPSAPATPNP